MWLLIVLLTAQELVWNTKLYNDWLTAKKKKKIRLLTLMHNSVNKKSPQVISVNIYRLKAKI